MAREVTVAVLGAVATYPRAEWRAAAGGVLLIGGWRLADDGRVERCPAEPGALRQALVARRPRWLLVAQIADEAAVQRLVMAAWSVCSDLRLAMLGPVDDVRRCERWLRRGCRLYFSDQSDVATVLHALDCANTVDATVVDRAFYLRSLRSRLVGLVPSLTPRQQEVLGLLGQNLTNAEIAGTLHLSDNTVEFHIRRLLMKLGARNRMQAVSRAVDLGLL
jgi:DNA-binding NarL/FixJ family response regulator